MNEKPKILDAEMPVQKAALRIVVLVSFANVGGAQIAALRLARGLQQRGHAVTVRFLYEQCPVNSVDYPYEIVRKTARLSPRDFLAIVGRVFSQLRQEKPDVVLTFLPLACVVGQTCALFAGIRKRIVSHRMPIDTASRVMQVFDFLLAWLGVYTGVICVSEAVRARCGRYPARLRARAEVVHNGLLGFVPSTLSQSEARARFGLPDKVFTLIAVGRLASQKNYPLMLEIVRRLDGVHLAIGGDGPLRSTLAQQIERLGIGSRVHLLGTVGRGDIPDLLQAGDAFIQTSTYEGQSNTVLEALNAGLPVIVHDIPEQRETVVDPATGECAGELVPLDDVNGWVQAIARLRADAALRERASFQASHQAKLFTYQRMIERFESILQG